MLASHKSAYKMSQEPSRLLYLTPLLEQRVTKMLVTLSRYFAKITVLCPEDRISEIFLDKIPNNIEIKTYKYIFHPQLGIDPIMKSSIRKAVEDMKNNQKIKTIIFRDVLLFGFFSRFFREKFPDSKQIVDIADNFEFTDGLYPMFSIKGRIHRTFALSAMEKIKYADSVLVVCDENKKRIAESYKVPKKRIFIVENSPLRELCPEDTPISKIEKSIVYSGQLNEKVRDISEVVEAVARTTNWTLYLYITNPQSKELRKLRRKIEILKMKNRVFFKEPVSFDESVKVLSIYEIGIIPHNNIDHVRYTLPNKLYDYIMAGILVAVKAVPILESFVSKYQIGFSYKSSRELEEKLIDLDETGTPKRGSEIKLCWEDMAEVELLNALDVSNFDNLENGKSQDYL